MGAAADSGSPPGQARRWLKNVAVLAGTAWLTQLTLAVLFENQLIYHPESAGDWEAPARFPGRLEDVLLQTADGPVVHGWYLRAEAPRATLLYFHGNAGNLSHRLDWMLALAMELRVDVLGIDYRGYGRSTGAPSEAGLYLDAAAAYEYLVGARATRPSRIVVYGKSLGGAPACELAATRPVAGLILQSAFTSVPDMGRTLLPFLPVGLLIRHRMDNLSKVPGITVPKLIVHSRSDEVIPFWMGEALAKAAAEPKTFVTFEGVGHNELVDVRRRELLEAFGRLIDHAVR